MRTATLHNSATTQATSVAPVCPQGRTYAGLGSMMSSDRPWSNEILVEGAAFARGSKDPIQEALL
jgi:hypothetical protein